MYFTEHMQTTASNSIKLQCIHFHPSLVRAVRAKQVIVTKRQPIAPSLQNISLVQLSLTHPA